MACFYEWNSHFKGLCNHLVLVHSRFSMKTARKHLAGTWSEKSDKICRLKNKQKNFDC